MDVWLPRVRLALEYQGQHHYRDHYLFGAHAVAQQRDAEKARACRAQGIDLVAVPYWWTRSAPALAASIRRVRPDLLVDWAAAHLTAEPISPLEPVPAPAHNALEGQARLVARKGDGNLLLRLCVPHVFVSLRSLLPLLDRTVLSSSAMQMATRISLGRLWSATRSLASTHTGGQWVRGYELPLAGLRWRNRGTSSHGI